jgi:type I restriction enzyme, S subunit
MVDLAERTTADEVPSGYRMTELGLLPEEWTVARFADVTEFSKKGRGVEVADSIPFIPMALLPEAGLYVDHWEDRAPEEVRSGVYFRDGDLLLAKITPCLENGKQGIVRGVPGGWGYATTEVYPIHGTDVLTEYLAYFLRHQPTRKYLIDRMEGTTGRQRLPKAVVENLPIPLPLLAEQRAIADVLSTVQRAREATEAVIASVRELKRSLMRHLFTYGPVPVGEVDRVRLKETEIGLVPEHWTMTTLGAVARIGNGSTPKRDNQAYWVSGSTPWLNSGSVHQTRIGSADQFVTDVALAECHLPLVPAGSVVVAITGQGKTLGTAAMVSFHTTVNQHLAYLCIQREAVLPEYVLAYLQTRYDHLRTQGSAGGSTKAALTCGLLKRYPLPLPPIDEQRAIAMAFDAIDAKSASERLVQRSMEVLYVTLLGDLMCGALRVTPSRMPRG